MNIFDDFTERVKTALRHAVAEDFGTREVDLSRVVVEPPRDSGHGELATNAAMVLAKALGVKPRELAESLARRLGGDADVVAVTSAGPGLVTLSLKGA